MKNKNFTDLLALPWTYTIKTAKDENNNTIYIVSVNELPGATTDAKTIQEAMELIKEVMLAAFELYEEQGEEIPVPVDEEAYQGNISYRTTSRRHHLLAREAQKRNVSLSKLIDEVIDTTFSKKK